MLRRLLAVLAVLAAVPVGAGVVRSSTNVSGSGGGTFTGGTITSPILAPAVDNCAAPPYSFSGATDTGVCSNGTGVVTFRSGGANRVGVGPYGGIQLISTVPFSWSNSSTINDASDLFLWRDAANTLAQRNGTNAQTFNWYYSYTDASNYQRGALKTSAGGIEIAAETAGSGADNLDIRLTPAGVGTVKVANLDPAVAGAGMDVGGTTFYQDYGWMYPGNTGDDSGQIGRADIRWASAFFAGSIQGSRTKALTEGAATAVTQIAVPQTAGSNSADAVVQWTVYASDGTDTQTRRGSTYLAAVNKAGTETCTVGDIGTPVVAVSAGTLTCTTSCITGLTNVVQFALDCTSSLTQTSLNAMVRLDMDQPNTVTPQ